MANSTTSPDGLSAPIAAVLESITDAFFALDGAGRFTYVNAHAERLLQHGRAGLLGQVFWDVFPEAVSTRLFEACQRALRDQMPVEAVDRYAPFDAWYEVRAFPTDGGLLVYFRDVTQRQQAEEERAETERQLREATQRLRFHVENSPLAVVEFDADFRIIRWSEEAEHTFGWTAEEILGRDMYAIPWIHPDDLGSVHRIQEAMAAGTRPRNVNPNRNIRKDGATIWCEWYNSALVDADGKMISVLSQVLDVTERIRAEAALRESEDRFRATFEQAAVGIAHIGLNGSWLRMNQRFCEIAGYSREELSGMTFLQITHPDDIAADQEMTRKLLAGEIAFYRLEKRYVRKDGSVVWVVLTKSLLRDPEKKPRHFIAVVANITERKRMEKALTEQAEALRAADRAKDEFLAMLAHELRNPLAAISNATELVRLRAADAPAFEKPLEILGRQTRHMARLVDDLLDVARITRGHLELRTEPTDIARIARQAVEGIRPLCDRRHQTLTACIANDPLWLEGDPARLEQVLSNLLHNSSKYTEPGGAIEVTVGREDNEARVCVRDNGIGIAPEMLSRVFDLFAQEDQTLDRARGGLGIGLTLAQRLVEMHGGSIEAHSDGHGKGSAFCIRLPLLAHEPHMMPSASAEGPAQVALQVLVVEDNPDAALTMSDILRLWGHTARTAADGPAALEMARRHPPDVVLIDIGLPGMDGYEVARRLREEDASPRPCLVALTGYAQEQDRERVRDAGFDHHFVKPAPLDALRALLSRDVRSTVSE